MQPENPSTKAEDYQDLELACFEPYCGMSFTWTSGEQAFMAQLLAANKIIAITNPRRCVKCRADKRDYFSRKEN